MRNFLNRLILCLAIVIAFGLRFEVAAEGAQIGRAEKVVNQVFGGGLAYPLTVQKPVARDEQINTSNDSATTLLFDDGSALDIGPNAQVMLDNFVYDPASKKLSGAAKVGRGVLRFVGAERPKDIRVLTPACDLGVRGTIFLLVVTQQGATEIQVLEGVIELSTPSGQQATLNPGDFYQIAIGGPPQLTAPTASFQAAVKQIDVMLGPQRRAARKATVVPAVVAPNQMPAPTQNRPELRDASGRVVGFLLYREWGRIDALDTRNVLRAFYDPGRNQTLDPTGRVIGQGNRLAQVMGVPALP